MNLVTQAHSFIRNEAGQDLIEYALLVGLIALVAFFAIDETGEMARDVFTNIAGQLASV